MGTKAARLSSENPQKSSRKVYLEALLRRETYGVFVALDRVMPKLVACSIWVILCMLLGTVITLILKKLPILRKLL